MYIYNATGVKLKKTVNVSITDYAGNYIYENDELQFFNHPEGYATLVNAADYDSGFDYVYQYKNHLGNIRLSYTDNNGDLEIVEENNYYSFGLTHKGYNNNINPNGNSLAENYKYNNKELEESLNLNTYDLGARQMDPALGRFMQIDPLADIVNYQSPYVVADNNPVFFVDVFGLQSKPNFWQRLKTKVRNLFGRRNRAGGTRFHNWRRNGNSQFTRKSERRSRKVERRRRRAESRSSNTTVASTADPYNGRTKMNPMDFGMSGLAIMDGGTSIEGVENMYPIASGIIPPTKPRKPRDWFDGDVYGILKTNVDFLSGLRWSPESTLNSFGSYHNSILNKAKSGVMLGSILKTLASDPKLKLYIQIAEGNDSGKYDNATDEVYERRVSNLVQYLKKEGVSSNRIKIIKNKTTFATFIK